MIDYKYTGDKDTEDTCIKCHSIGRVLLQRRTKEEWELLIAMHRGYYPLSDFQAFRRGGPPPRDQQPAPDGRRRTIAIRWTKRLRICRRRSR